MLRKFVWWFIIFGLSFLVQKFGWTDQGTAFIFIDLGGSVLMSVVVIMVCLFAGDGMGEKIGFSIISAIYALGSLAIIMFATWGATQLFDVQFAVAYQIMSFGQCLCTNSKNDN